MILKPFILTLILLATAAGGQRPNILFIAIDDLRPELGCYGATQVKTPHIDKLAASGMRFERAYCQVPICMGSRASLMTGILPTAKRFVGDCRADVDAPAAMTLPEAFRKAGYTTLSNGKIFHALDDAADRSWSEAPWLTRNNMRSFDPETTRRLSKTKQRGRIYELPDVADDAYPDGETAQKTIKDLQRLKQEGKPFFLACGFFKPHMPFYAPKTMHLAIRVPLIVKVPGKKPGASSSLVETTDIFPSLCALAGITAPATVQGRDFTALLDDPKKTFHEAAYSRFLSADAVITDRFNYTSYDNGKSEMLYDLSKDPQENRNVAGDPKYAETVATMKKLLRKRQDQAAK